MSKVIAKEFDSWGGGGCNLVCETDSSPDFFFSLFKYFLMYICCSLTNKSNQPFSFIRQTWRRQTSLHLKSANIYVYQCHLSWDNYAVSVSECPSWSAFSFFLYPASSLSNILAFALADQQTNVASLDEALSHMAVFFFHDCPCCLPL